VKHPCIVDLLDKKVRLVRARDQPRAPTADSLAAERLEEQLNAEDIAVEGRNKWPRGGESIYFRDPDGHLLELATPGLWPGY